MAQLPTIPAFTQGESGPANLANLQNLANAVAFLANMDVRPTWKMYKAGTLALVANTWTNLGLGQKAFDSDNICTVGASSLVTIKTQGYYALEICAQVISGTTATLFELAFLFTAGANNPHIVNGTTKRFGRRGGQTASSTASACSASCTADIAPIVMFPGDTIAPQVNVQSALTLQNNANGAYDAGRFAVTFTGQWLRTGS